MEKVIAYLMSMGASREAATAAAQRLFQPQIPSGPAPRSSVTQQDVAGYLHQFQRERYPTMDVANGEAHAQLLEQGPQRRQLLENTLSNVNYRPPQEDTNGIDQLALHYLQKEEELAFGDSPESKKLQAKASLSMEQDNARLKAQQRRNAALKKK